MASNTLIKVVCTKKGKQPRASYFTYKSLTGTFRQRLLKVHHKMEVTELCLDTEGQQSTIYDVLTKDELDALVAEHPQLKQGAALPPEPKPLPKASIKTLALVGNDEEIAEAAKPVEIPNADGDVDIVELSDEETESKTESLSTDYSNWEFDELKDLLLNNDVKVDKRVKKKEKLIELIKTNNL
jgi:hypothetical protein